MLGEQGALFVLIAWLPFGIAMLSQRDGARATLIVLLGGILLLPEAIALDLPGLPSVGKTSVVSLALLIGMLLFHSRRARAVGLGTHWLDWVVASGMVFALGTVATNRDSTAVDRGLVLWDSASEIFAELTLLAIPFWVGRVFFRDAKDLRLLYVILLAAAAVYALLALVEVRMSPQLNKWVYGYRQHSWGHVVRFGGWRPQVFMSHGLALALFLCVSTVAAFVAYKTRLVVFGFSVRYVAWFLGAVTVLCKSLAAIVYTAVFAPLVFLGRPRTITRVGLVAALTFAIYPVLRATDVFPTDGVAAVAGAISAERQQSLTYRFDFEDEALARAMKRPWFGWGGFGRATYREGQTRWTSMVIDGYWILRFGHSGVFALLAFMLVIVWPVWLVHRALPRIRAPDEARQLAGLAVILAVFAIDTLPNAINHGLPLLIAGAMTTLSTTLPRAARRREEETLEDAVAASEADDEPAPVRPARVAARAATTRDLIKGRRQGA